MRVSAATSDLGGVAWRLSSEDEPPIGDVDDPQPDHVAWLVGPHGLVEGGAEVPGRVQDVGVVVAAGEVVVGRDGDGQGQRVHSAERGFCRGAHVDPGQPGDRRSDPSGRGWGRSARCVTTWVPLHHDAISGVLDREPSEPAGSLGGGELRTDGVRRPDHRLRDLPPRGDVHVEVEQHSAPVELPRKVPQADRVPPLVENHRVAVPLRQWQLVRFGRRGGGGLGRCRIRRRLRGGLISIARHEGAPNNHGDNGSGTRGEGERRSAAVATPGGLTQRVEGGRANLATQVTKQVEIRHDVTPPRPAAQPAVPAPGRAGTSPSPRRCRARQRSPRC